jgi:tRNA dimethylallyltransferase
MDIGTGKVTKHEQKLAKHWLLDVASPKRSYNVTHFVRDAKKAITDIQKRGKIPIICGGTGFWAQALIEDTTFPAVKPDIKLRKKLEKYSAEKLFAMLVKKDQRRAKTIDRHNKVRLIRALEICETIGAVPPLCHSREGGNPNSWIHDKARNDKHVIIALNPDKKILRKNIETRLEKRLKLGMIDEVRRLRTSGVSWKKLESFGLEYKNIAFFLQKKITQEVMCENILRESFQYAKRQLTWLRRFEKMGAHIYWGNTPQEAKRLLKFLF